MTRAATPVRPEPTEAQFQAAIVELAHMCGWQTNHTFRSTSRRDGGWRTATTCVGFPDLLLWRPGQFLIREIKATGGRLTVEQRSVLAGLRAAGIDAGTWFPSDWPEIERTLRTVPARASITRARFYALEGGPANGRSGDLPCDIPTMTGFPGGRYRCLNTLNDRSQVRYQWEPEA